jgi:hypothetical protein
MYPLTAPRNGGSLSEPLMNRSKALANAVLAAANDSDRHVQFQVALTLGDLQDSRVLATMTQLVRLSSAGDKTRVKWRNGSRRCRN